MAEERKVGEKDRSERVDIFGDPDIPYQYRLMRRPGWN